MHYRSNLSPAFFLGFIAAASMAHADTSVSLSTAANVNALFNNGSKVTNGGIDRGDTAYSETLTGTSVAWSGSTFKLGSSGTVNGASGTTVTLPTGNFATLKVLATAVDGDQANQSFVISYTDGTTTTIRQSMSDWFYPNRYPGESIALTLAYRLA